jgi:hypothetical protein
LQPPFGSRQLKRKQALILYSTFPIEDSVRRLVVPAGENDPAFPEAQESIIRCAKDQQDDPSIKKMASGAEGPKIPDGYGYRGAVGSLLVLPSFLLPQKEILECGDCFRRTHPLAEKMIFLTDSANQILGWQF